MVEKAGETMSGAREGILNRSRIAPAQSADTRLDAYRRISRRYITAGDQGVAARLELFTQRLHDYEAMVYRCQEHEISSTVAQALKSRGKRGLLIPPGIERAWLPDQFVFLPDETFTYEQLDQSQGVLTACAVAIAVTGTIILQHTAGAGRRALTLIPDYHLCIVFANQIAETVPEGFRQLEHVANSPLTMISGPSATSDIEMTRVKGVHGPRVLDVIVVAENG